MPDPARPLRQSFTRRISRRLEMLNIAHRITRTSATLPLVAMGLLACGAPSADEAFGFARPQDSRFTKVVLATDLDEPMQFEMLPDGRVLFVERKGKVRVYDPDANQVSTVAEFSVSIGYYSESGEELSPTGEDGMHGVAVDPDYLENHWIYLFYTRDDGDGTILARYTWNGGMIDTTSKKLLLTIPNQRISCCHLGGGLLFDQDGNLLITTGDNTPNDPRGYAPIDERPGRHRYDAQRSSGNTNDLRGKILRIHPEPDGNYSIPEGNLFPEGTPNTRPEIYTMGNRNPWRLSIDSETGWLYWGEVGPSGTADSAGMGPRSYDEFNQAREAGNYGWPYFIAQNEAYWEYDYAEKQPGRQFDPAHPINDSPNNTGLRELPPARSAMIWYPQSAASDFPIPGSGSNSAAGGPIYRRADFKDSERPFPSYYDGKWLITDWTRGWIMAVTMDEQGQFVSMEEFAPHVKLSGPIDMEFGPEGDLYVLEYGRTPYVRNSDAKLSRIEYNAGNRRPVVQVSASKTASAAPATIDLSAAGTIDYDGDALSYEWVISSADAPTQRVTGPEHTVILEEVGDYQAQLTVSDGQEQVRSESIEISVGNDPPVVAFDFHGANKSFYFDGANIHYSVQVVDLEDGDLSEGSIDPSAVALSVDRVSSLSKARSILPALYGADASVPIETVRARQLMRQSDCEVCHTLDSRLLGPAFADIARKYTREPEAVNYLAEKIVEGGSGVWGETAMPAHPAFEDEEARTIAEYILTVLEPTQSPRIPLDGTYQIDVSQQVTATGSSPSAGSSAYLFRASYTDRGSGPGNAQSSAAVVLLRNPLVLVSEVDRTGGIEINHQIFTQNSTATPKDSFSYLGVDTVDLTGITKIAVYSRTEPDADASPVGRIEIRLGSPSGELIGQRTLQLHPVENASGMFAARAVTDIQRRTGVHDVYVVLVGLDNEEARDVQIGAIQFLAD